MAIVSKNYPLVEVATLQEAFTAAAEKAAYSGGTPVVGLLYYQGGRRFVSTSLSLEFLLSIVKETKAVSPKKRHLYDSDVERNRPMDEGHCNTIRDYLVHVQKYILPPILLSSTEPLEIFVVKSPARTIPCLPVLPRAEYLCVTEGQHRIEGVRRAMRDRRDLSDDAIAVSIAEEENINQTHQDFYDAAQTKPISPAQLVQYDQRDGVNGITRELIEASPLLRNRIARASLSVPKKSTMLYTTNMIKRACLVMLTGLPGTEETAESLISAARDLWLNRLTACLQVLTEHNEPWCLVAERPPESGQTVDIPNLREKYLHFVGGGLLVMAGVVHTICTMSKAYAESLTIEQESALRDLASIPWERSAPLWRRSLVSVDGTIQPHRAVLRLAVADVKQLLHLPLTESEEARLALVAQTELERRDAN